jgi:Rrf2 family protein
MGDILKISDAASLAVHTMVLLAAEPERVHSTHEIAQELGVSEAHLSKVLQRLGKAGFVRSIRGPRGGFVPADGIGEVRLLDVYESIEGPLRLKTCLLDKPICKGNGCIFGELLKTVNSEVRGHLSRTRLADVTHIVKETVER